MSTMYPPVSRAQEKKPDASGTIKVDVWAPAPKDYAEVPRIMWSFVLKMWNRMSGRNNPKVTAATDAAGLVSAVSKNRSLGAVSAAVSVMNDPSPKNLVITGLGFVPGLDFPVAVGSAAWDGSQFVGNQVITPVFTPDASQAATMGDGYGHTVPNPGMMDGSELIPH